MSQTQDIDRSFDCIRDALNIMRSGKFRTLPSVREQLAQAGYTQADVEDALKRIANEYAKQDSAQ